MSNNHFIAPWMRRVLSVRNEVVFINPLGIKAVPDHRRIRSSAGSRKALFILAAFYDNEPALRGILTKILYDRLDVQLGLFSNMTPASRTVPRNEKLGQSNKDIQIASRKRSTTSSHSRNSNHQSNNMNSSKPFPSNITRSNGQVDSTKVCISKSVPTTTPFSDGRSILEPQNIAPTSSSYEEPAPLPVTSQELGNGEHRTNNSPLSARNSDMIGDVFNNSSLSAELQQPIPQFPNNSPLPPPDLHMYGDEDSYDPFGRHDDESRDL